VTLHRQSPAFPDFENQLLGDQNRALRKPSLFESVIRSPILPETGACEPGRILKMNARLDVRDALLVHKMKRWALIARTQRLEKGAPFGGQERISGHFRENMQLWLPNMA
jgi:hypothetical protein